MKTYYLREIPAQPAKTIHDLVKTTCDLCGREADKSQLWAEDRYEINETVVEVRASSGSSYPEGGQKETVSFDICPDCFHAELVPFLESKGAKSRKSESDW